MSSLQELYQEYGQLLIQAEILQSRIQTVKQQIATELNKQPVSPQLVKDAEHS